jgi:hypothetical protein
MRGPPIDRHAESWAWPTSERLAGLILGGSWVLVNLVSLVVRGKIAQDSAG